MISFIVRKEKLWKCVRPSKCLFKAAYSTVEEEILPKYIRYDIPMKRQKNMVNEILSIYRNMQNIVKLPVDRRAANVRIDHFK